VYLELLLWRIASREQGEESQRLWGSPRGGVTHMGRSLWQKRWLWQEGRVTGEKRVAWPLEALLARNLINSMSSLRAGEPSTPNCISNRRA